MCLANRTRSPRLRAAFGRTTKSTYPDSCSEVWSAVKDTLSNVDNYSVDASDDAAMSASYHPKHTVHVTVTGRFFSEPITSPWSRMA